jgi:hypothetical protein
VNPLLSFARHRRLRPVAVWLMAMLVPMHAVAASVLAALGPLHTHAPARAVAILEDFRRLSSPATLAPRHVATALGHFHVASAERHRHATSDASVQLVGDGASTALDADTSSSGIALAAFVAMPEANAEWHCEIRRDVRPSHAAWVPQVHVSEPFERPPRIA